MDAPRRDVVDAFIDLRSPYSYLALGPARALAQRLGVTFDWWPFITDFRAAYGGEVEQRTSRDVAKVKYLYMDCRRLAKLQGLTIRSTVKLWDASLGSQAFLFAKARNRLWEFLDPTTAPTCLTFSGAKAPLRSGAGFRSHRPVAIPNRKTWPAVWRSVWAVSDAPRLSTRRNTSRSTGAVIDVIGNLPIQGNRSFSILSIQRAAYCLLHPFD